jgi:ribosome-dependent ATPase
LPANEIAGRIDELLERYDLKTVADEKPESLPLGVKQRLQLAVAVLHRPPILILDEPTSGVDPVARDAFWRTLIDLSRNDGVTIFLSTHFMNEAERCDRISLMHQGRVLAVGAPKALVKDRGSVTLEDTFISYLEEAAATAEKSKARATPSATEQVAEPAAPQATAQQAKPTPSHASRRFDPGRLWAYARLETIQILRDPIRLAFAFLGPIILMFAFGYGITFDVENLKYAAFDQDQTPESRRLLESFSGSHYFTERPPIGSTAELEQRMRSGELAVVAEIPSGFGRDLVNLHSPEVAFWIDDAMPFRGETTQGYVTGLMLRYAQDLVVERFGPNAPANAYVGSINIENRFRYNQAFKSVFSMVPSVVVMILVLIPAIMASIAVVREKETGSISKFPLHPHQQIRIPLWQAVPVCRRGDADLRHPAHNGVCRLPRAGQGVVWRARPRGAAVRFLDVRLRATCIVLHPNTGRRRLRYHHSGRHPHRELLWSARARFFPHRPGTADRPDVSSRVVPADQRRDFHERTALFRSRPECARPRAIRGKLSHCRAADAEEAGAVTCRWRATRQGSGSRRPRRQ